MHSTLINKKKYKSIEKLYFLKASSHWYLIYHGIFRNMSLICTPLFILRTKIENRFQRQLEYDCLGFRTRRQPEMKEDAGSWGKGEMKRGGLSKSNVLNMVRRIWRTLFLQCRCTRRGTRMGTGVSILVPCLLKGFRIAIWVW